MPRLRLSFVSAFNERVQPLMDGSIQPEGVELMPTYSDPSETFWRQLKFHEFEIPEMSLSSYLIARSRGMDFVAIPVFPSRRFMHAELSYHVDSGIRAPGDVTGKRIGVGQYQQTASLWVRGTLEHDFGVSQYKGRPWRGAHQEKVSQIAIPPHCRSARQVASTAGRGPFDSGDRLSSVNPQTGLCRSGCSLL